MMWLMTRSPRGLERRVLELDFDLYRVAVPLPDHPGSRLSVIDMRPRGARQTLVLQHGFAGCAETWEHQIAALCAGYRVVAPDLRGHGQSDDPKGRYDLERLCDDLDAIVDHLALPERFALVGHSFGGVVALRYAARRPDRVERLVLVATPSEFPLPPGAAWLSRLPLWALRPVWRFRPRWNATPRAMKRMFNDSLRPWRAPTTLEVSGLPILLLNGARDRYFPDRVYDELAACLPWADRMEVGAAKHKLQLERPAAVTRAIQGFVGDGVPERWRDPKIDADQARQRPWLASYPPSVPGSVPLPVGTLSDYLGRAARAHPRRTAVVGRGRRWSYRRLEQDVGRLCGELIALGLRPGDRVLIRLGDRPELHLACYAVLGAGGVIVLPSPAARRDDLIEQLARSRARWMIAADADHSARQAAERSAIHRCLLVGRTRDRSLGDGRRNEIALDARLAGPPRRLQAPTPTLDALALLAFTGTAESDPTIAASQASLLADALQLRHWLPPRAVGIRILTALDLDRGPGLTLGLALPLLLAATVELGGDDDRLPRPMASRTGPPTLLIGGSDRYARWLEQPALPRTRLDRCMACLCVGDPLSIEQLERFERLTRTRLVEVYHAERLGAIGLAQPLGERGRPGSMGFPLPNTDARVVALDGEQPLPADAVGRLQLRGPQFAPGPTPDRASRVDRGTPPIDPADPEGGPWLDTGDLAVMDAAGTFRLVGPADCAIQGPGGAIFPRDVAEVLHAHAAVREVAVLGDGAPPGRERVLAGVILQAGAGVGASQLLAHCRSRLPAAEVPAEIRVLDALPRQASGRLDRDALRRTLAQGQPEIGSMPNANLLSGTATG